MMNKNLLWVAVLVVIAVIAWGFKLATQSGLTGAAGSTQNDGYAAAGGLLILAGGLMIGFAVSLLTTKNKK